MTKIEGIKKWSDVPVLEDGDILKGGLDGLANVQAKALVDRTEYLKEELQEVKEQTAGLGPNMGGAGEGSGGNLPAGTIIAFGGTTAPAGFLECNGATLSRTTFAGLFAAIGTIWGESSSMTFKIPNFTEAERFLRSRSEILPVGTVQGDAIRNITGRSAEFRLSGIADNTSSGAMCTKTGTWFGGAPGANVSNTDSTIYFDASKVVPTATENRPKSAVVMYCIKASDSVIDPEQLLAQGVVNDVANKADRNEVQELAGTRLWVSGEYTPVANTPTIVTHGLNIDPLRCKCDVLLRCVVAEWGYAVGDFGISLYLATEYPATGIQTTPCIPSLAANKIQVNSGNHANSVYVMNKTTGECKAVTLANWRYIFRIWY